MAPRRICVVTGTRAEYGAMYWLMKEIDADEGLVLQLVVTGTHLSEKFGETWKVIAGDGFAIDEKIDIDVGDDTPVGVARSMGLCVSGMAEALARLAPDVVVVLGDRYEILAAAEAAMIARIPIAHIHGGETTEGAIDDSMRHAITKLAHLHFTAAPAYRQRVLQLGEDPDRVFLAGAVGLDNIDRLSLLDRPALARDLGLTEGREYLLVTYHPVTTADDGGTRGAGEMLAAFDTLADYWVVLTGVNADAGHDRIARLLSEYAAANPDRVSLHASLGQARYLSAMKFTACVVGNSSSGIIEAPALGVPTVNIGTRQTGRLRAASIVDCGEDRDEIAAAIRRACDPGFRAGLGDMVPPYGGPGASAAIKEFLKTADLTGISRKSFRDMPLEGVAP